MAQPYTIKSGDPRNDVSPAAPKGFSKFNLSHRFLQTHRFGEITPHESFETIKGAKDSVRLMNDTSSYSLKAPLKTEMFQKRSNFFVPLQAIIRNNWELLVAQPNDGDDVPQEVDGVVQPGVINDFFSNLLAATFTYGWESTSVVTNARYLYVQNLLKNLLVCESFFSQGSLLKQLYYDFSHCVYFIEHNSRSQKIRTFDAILERILSALAPVDSTSTGIVSYSVSWYDQDGNITDSFKVVSDSVLIDLPFVNSADRYISFRHFLDLARQNLNFSIDLFSDNVASPWFTSSDGNLVLSSTVGNWLFGDYFVGDSYILDYLYYPIIKSINFDKISAYQIIAAHFFSLDHVDYIYSAELYRQLIQYYVDQIVTDDVDKTFTWNGLKLHYDALSGAMMTKCIFNSGYIGFLLSPFTFSFEFCYLTALFSFRHSLRYLDYFTGGRTRPLSVGSSTDPRANINVAVNNNAVNGVEMILAQNAARYLNFAQRVGKKISQWLDKMFPGGVPKPDMHDPQWLSSTGDALNPEQTQNTGAGQLEEAQSITARFKNDSNRYMFTIQPDRPGYIICVTYYDVPRAYAYATAKENMHADRYDRFNPFFQYNGSQEVSKQELGLAGDAPFSYQGRYEEYKQNYDVVSGGFVENLPGFAFIADVQSGLPMQQNLNPTYVRSWNCELDPFYLALTGYGLAAYFHFIVKNVNIIECVRPMEYAPQLM